MTKHPWEVICELAGVPTDTPVSSYIILQHLSMAEHTEWKAHHIEAARISWARSHMGGGGN